MLRRLLLLLIIVSLSASNALALDKAKLRWARKHPAIDSISVLGNQYFKDSEIKDRLYSRKRTIWRAIQGDRRSRIQRETLRRDTLEVKFIYLSEGFLNCRVSHSYEPIGPDSLAMIRISIEEGKQYRYGRKSITGNFDASYTDRLRGKAQTLKSGEPASPFEMKQLEFDLKTFFANRGYPYATVQVSLDTVGEPFLSEVAIRIEAGPLVHFGNVQVEGAVNYPDYAVRRELKITPGKIYRRDDIIESQRRLFESGYFSTFQLRQVDGSSDRLNPDFSLSVRERKVHHVTFKTGAAQSAVRELQWDVSAAFGKRNFLGSRRYDVLADYSFSVGSDTRLIVHRYRLRYTEPWFLGIRMPLLLSGEVHPRIKDPVQEFDKRSWLASAAISKWWKRKVRLGFGIEYQQVKLYGAPNDSLFFGQQPGENEARRKIYANFRRDSRDDLFLPRNGSVTELSGESFGGFMGGDQNFFKLFASWSRYQIVWPGWIYAVRLRGAWAEEFGATEIVPPDEALYLGGGNSVRGFGENLLGPLRQDGTPAGAQYTLVVNQEFRWKTVQFLKVAPLIGSLMKSFPLWQSVFVDIGNGFATSRDIRYDNFAFAYGTGFQIVTPAGPIRLDYAQVLETRNFAFADQWHFTILYAF